MSDKDKIDIPTPPTIVIVLALVPIVASLWFYFSNFQEGLSSDQAVWGTFGDFVGGTLNPIYGFFGLLALLATLIQQNRALTQSSQQLKISRTELALSREELRKTSEAATNQAQYMKIEIERSDLYRLIERLAERINRNFNENRMGRIRAISTEPVSVHEILRRRKGGDEGPVPPLRDKLNDPTSNASTTFNWLLGDLKRLKDYVEEYGRKVQIGDSAPEHLEPRKVSLFQEYYRHEFEDLVMLIYELKRLPADDLYRFYVAEYLASS